MNKINRLKVYLAAGLLAVSSTAAAVPTLTFDGQLAFDPLSEILQITAKLTGAFGVTGVDLDPTSATELTLEAMLTGSSSFMGITTGSFGTASANPDISITDASMTELLTGNIDSMLMIGADGRPSGQLQGYFAPTGGLLQGDFGDPSSVFALVLDLSIDFNSQMFTSSFNGIADGAVIGTEISFPLAAVPEPSLLVLLGTGFLILFSSRRRS